MKQPCSVEGCEGVTWARLLCSRHYGKWRRFGSATIRTKGEVVDGKRICPRCQVDTPIAEYPKGRARYCRPCINARAREWRAAHPEWDPKPTAWHECRCDYCDEMFMANKRRRRYCSTACSTADKHHANWVHVNARRARLRDAFVEAFDRTEIFERDGWVCQLCHQPVDPALTWPHPESASLDHVVPIARGGKHSRANAQASHLHCNVVKSDRLPEVIR